LSYGFEFLLLSFEFFIMRNFARDTIGELLELGKSTVKTTVKQVGQTFSPLKLTEKALGIDEREGSSEEKKSKKENFTPLNTKRLEEKYEEGKDAKYQALKRRLFNQIRQEERRILEQKKLEEARKKQLEEERKRKEEEEKKKKEQEELVVPKGKVRRSIFAFTKKIKSKFAEFRAGSGKN